MTLPPDPGHPNFSERLEIARLSHREPDCFVATRMMQSGDDDTWDGYDIATGRVSKTTIPIVGGKGHYTKRSTTTA